MKARTRTTQKAAIALAARISEIKGQGLIPDTLPKLMSMLRKEIAEPFNQKAVQQCCEHLDIKFKRKRSKSARNNSYLRGKQAKSVAFTIRKLVQNIEECIGVDDGELLHSGVREALTAIAGGKNVESDFFQQYEEGSESPALNDTDFEILSANLPDEDHGVAGVVQPHARVSSSFSSNGSDR
jgi:hypothetical protein